MGKLTADEVVALLTEAGFRSARGYPGERMPMIQKPAVAVNPQKEDSACVTMAVHVLSPVASGAAVCEDYARRVAQLLRSKGADCTQESCTHDGRGDRFWVRILATWQQDTPACPYGISLGGAAVPHAVKCSVRQEIVRQAVEEMGQATPAGYLSEPEVWRITLEEQIPPDEPEAADPAEPFELLIRRGSKGELYGQCRWESILREDTAEGLHQVRVAAAGSKEVLTYE